MHEPRIPGLRRALRAWIGARAIEREVDAELRFHLETRRDELIGSGVLPEEAARLAGREFGDLDASRRELARVDRRRHSHDRRADWAASIAQDLRYAWRGMRASPGLAAAVVLTVALGIGVNAAVTGIADRLLFAPPAHVAAPDRLANIYFQNFSPFDKRYIVGTTETYGSIAALDAAPAVSGIAARYESKQSIELGTLAWRGPVEVVTFNYFTLLGTRAELGRTFAAADSADATPGVVVSDRIWRDRLNGDSRVLGRSIRVGSHVYPIIGVAPPGFSGAGLDAVDCWLPFTQATAAGVVPMYRGPGSYLFDGVLRLRPRATIAAANAQLTTLYRNWRAVDPTNPFAGTPADTGSSVFLTPVSGVRSYNDAALSPQARVAGWLALLSGLVLLIACANVAGLLLVRALRRSREFAMRSALGMSRGRMLTQLFVESALLAVIGAAVALVALYWATPLLRNLVAPDVAWESDGFSSRALVLIGCATLVGVLLIAFVSAAIPARLLAKGANQEFRAAGHSVPRARSRAHTALVIAQSALCLVLLSVAGLFVQSLHRVRTLDYGFDLDVIAAEMSVPSGTSPAVASARYLEAAREVSRLPGVRAMGVADESPFRSLRGGGLSLPGRPQQSLPQSSTGGPYEASVSPGYFKAMGTSIVQGRAFTESDTVHGAASVVIVNESVARLYWPGVSPVGQCTYLDVAKGNEHPACTTVVGVAHDMRRMFVREEPRLEIFVPLTASALAGSNMTLLIRADRPQSVIPAIQRVVRATDPAGLAPEVVTLRTRLDPQTQSWLLGASVMSGFGVLALILVALGLYAIMSYTVASRAQEIGVRVALGAQRGSVVSLFVIRGLRIAAIGVVIGGVVSLYAGRRMADLLFQTSPTDPGPLLVAGGVLIVAALAASFIPALRAARSDPLSALRAD